jgi:hypothetical protein
MPCGVAIFKICGESTNLHPCSSPGREKVYQLQREDKVWVRGEAVTLFWGGEGFCYEGVRGVIIREGVCRGRTSPTEKRGW